MKKRMLSVLLASVVITGTLPIPIAAAGTDVAHLRSLDDVTYCLVIPDPWGEGGPDEVVWNKLSIKDPIPNTESNSLDEIYAWYNDPSTHLIGGSIPEIGMGNWWVDENKKTPAFTNQTPMWIEITSSTSEPLIFSEPFVVNRDTRIGNRFKEGVTNLNFAEGISIQNGTLMFKNEMPDTIPGYTNNQAIKVKLSKPIDVSEGGKLILENRYVDPEFSQDAPDVLVAPENQPAIVVNGGTVHSGCFQIERSENDTSEEPLIEVNSGEFIFEAGPSSLGQTETLMPTYESVISTERATVLKNGSGEAPAVTVAQGASATVKGGAFESTGEAPVFEVESGATLTLAGGTVKPAITSPDDDNKGENTITATGAPAIKVEDGGTLVFADGSESKVSASENEGQAIDLAGGAIVQQNSSTTIVLNGEEEAGANYVDNFGNMVLASGGTKTTDGEGGSSSPIPGNTVITPEGLTFTGKEELPTVGDDGAVSLPNGGTITNSDGNRIEVDGNNGSEIPSVVIGVIDKATGEVKQSATIKTDGTLQLSAVAFDKDINLTDDYSCSWKSEDETIAKVDEHGVVTGVAPGEATITATFTPNLSADGETALVDDAGVPTEPLTVTFKVIVEKSSSGGGGPTIPYYSITVPAETEEGKVTVSPTVAKQGDTVTVTVEPKEGYDLKELTATDRSGAAVELTRTEDGRYTFKMPGSGVEIKASFEASDPTAGLLDQEIVIRKAQVRDLADRTLNDKNTRVKFLVAPKTDVTYESSDDQVVTVDEEGYIRYTGLGEATITVRAEQTEEYKAAEVILTVKVGLKQPTFTPSSRDNGFTVTSSTVKGAKKFQVQYVLQGRSFKHDSAKSKTFTVDDKLRKGKVSAANKKIYRIRVRAISGDFKSKWSPVKTIPTK